MCPVIKSFITQDSRTRITILFLSVLGVLGVLGLNVLTATVVRGEDLEDGEDKDCEDHDDDNHHAEVGKGGLTVVFLIKRNNLLLFENKMGNVLY